MSELHESVARAIADAQYGDPVSPFVNARHERAAAAAIRVVLAEFGEYLSHQAWRCEYRTRYKRCVCGLDDKLAGMGLPPVPADDPEARL